eukprot:Filipodium_phascolosomae@DN1975_c0_g1_i1.p1
MKAYFVGVDVGTSSVRAGLFKSSGEMVATATNPIKINEPKSNFYEQSSDDIWNACGVCVRTVVKDIDPKDIGGIGFDATCSLVALNEKFEPVTVSPSGESQWNIIMWMDHRAEEEAAFINKSKHEILRYVGGTISLEMQTPKMLWLKKNMESTWKASKHIFCLPDYLTLKSTTSVSRSLCSLVCKWTYIAGGEKNVQQGWQESYFKGIGLGDIVDENYSKIGTQVLSPGTPVGQGLSSAAAEHFGLLAGTPVGTSIIDAHAGVIGCLSCKTESDLGNNKLAMICGTSTCHLTVGDKPVFVPGAWGPYFSAVIDGMWTNEAGQSAAGKLIDHVIETHVAYPQVKAEAEKKKAHIHEFLNQILDDMAKKEELSDIAYLTQNLHVYPDFHGNRAPIADPSLKGMISGLSLTANVEELARMYLATVQALAYGTNHILEALNNAGHNIKAIYICGGLSKNRTYAKSHADATGLPLVSPHVEESVLLGAAILGGCASGDFKGVTEAMKQMGGPSDTIQPGTENDAVLKRFHVNKYAVFKKMLSNQMDYKTIMSSN